MKAVILCGGKGTRIRDASESLPKPMLPIGDRPILWHIMKGFSAFGVRDFVLCLGYRSWTIKEFFLNYHAKMCDVTVRTGSTTAVEFHSPADEDWSVTLAETGEDTMTGGRVAAVRKYVEGKTPFLLTYGDGVADVNLEELVRFHRQHGKIATLTAVRPPSRFGQLHLDGSTVREFSEKPLATGGLINGGFFVLDGERVWDYLADDPATVLEREPLQKLAAAGELMAFEHGGFWEPMDTYREFLRLNDLWHEHAAPWKTW